MNVVRLKAGFHQDLHAQVMKDIVTVTTENRKLCAVLYDLKGPEIRTGRMAGTTKQFLERGATFKLYPKESADFVGDENGVRINFPTFSAGSSIISVIKPGDRVLLDDGLVQLRATQVTDTEITTEVLVSGSIGSEKRVNLPDVRHPFPILLPQDYQDIEFAIQGGADFIALSFVGSAEDVLQVRKVIDGFGGHHVKIISKIEHMDGLDNFDSILEVSHGIMIARSYLGAEIPLDRVSLAQKMIIRKCNSAGKPIIVAGQMLDSMITNPSPTRAEVSDVANAVLDGCDCVSLSGETTRGLYPIQSVEMMADICREAESATNYLATFRGLQKLQSAKGEMTVTETIASSAVKASLDLNTPILISLTETGTTARLVSKYRPAATIITVTSSINTARCAMLSRGLFPMLVNSMTDIAAENLIQQILQAAKKLGMCKLGDFVVITSGATEFRAGATNALRVATVK